MSRVHCVSAAPGAQTFQDPRPSGGLPLAQQYHTPADYQAYPAHGTQDSQAIYQQPMLYYPPVAHHRPLLPRTEPTAVPSQAAHGPQRAIRPNVSVPQGSDVSVHSPVGPVGYLSDRTEDWTSFIHFDQEDTVPPPGPTSYPTVYGHVSAIPTAPPMPDVNAVDSSFSQDSATATYGMPIAAPAPAETDEGRHRSHPLYNEGPSADGLYHCPYEKEPHCQHKPTKLKCNYDKFIDSHLKPFRCKIEACAKQEFSSTACLLRHEREAHGMHGHGDRPHLCYYPGCERGIPGNGFPRRYNLFDHMKRVHDHKEDSTSLTASPGPASDASNPRRAGGRKRKASGPTATEPPAQRQKPLPSPPAQAPPAALQRNLSYPPPTSTSSAQQNGQGHHHHHNRARKLHDRQRLYSQWANQRDLLTHQMGFVQSPDDEAHLQRLSQNIEELRRLSQEARRG
ncbi:hypothetical protein KC333_g1107 [Hortaea werneckii]|nr:hypothetical protein KC333_g1107 [Hortaea werneckii]KAI7323164.1 hypothetical protein KC326_g1645 [Hortaea werneckii]